MVQLDCLTLLKDGDPSVWVFERETDKITRAEQNVGDIATLWSTLEQQQQQ